jgi:lysophospholipase L1-like esterase
MTTGANGDAYGLFASSKMDTENKASLQITGDIDISAKIASNNYQKTTSQSIVSKLGDYSRCYQFSILAPSGKLFFWWSVDGSALVSVQSSVALPTANGADVWVRVTMDVDNGAGGYTVKFYTSTNSFVWTQLGTDVIGAAPTSIYAGTQIMYVGSRSASLDYFDGKIYRIFVKNGIDGKVVASPDFAQAFPSTITSFTDAEGNVWTNFVNMSVGNGSPGLLCLNASTAGQAIAYSTNATRFALQSAYEPQLVFINYGHNEGTTTDYQATYEGLATQLLTKWPNVGVVCIAQNPKISPATNIKQQELRNSKIALASARNNYGLIDVFTAFVKTGNIASITSADGIHPNTAGTLVWKNEALKLMLPLFN